MNKQEFQVVVTNAFETLKQAPLSDLQGATDRAVRAIEEAIDQFEQGFVPRPGQQFTGPNSIGHSYGAFKIQKPRTSAQMAVLLGYGDRHVGIGRARSTLGGPRNGVAWIKRTSHPFEILPHNNCKWVYELIGLRSDLAVFQTAKSILTKMGLCTGNKHMMHSSRLGGCENAYQYVLNHWVDLGYAEKDGVLFRLIKND